MKTTEITPELLISLKAKAAMATPGPWNLIGERKTIVTGSNGRLVSSSTHCMIFHPHLLDQATGADNAAYIAAANPEITIALIERIEELEQQADWLANKLADEASPMMEPPCGADCNPCDLACRQEQWREAARQAVGEKEE